MGGGAFASPLPDGLVVEAQASDLDLKVVPHIKGRHERALSQETSEP